jgi:SAM-dependent methyltransferase
VTGTPIRVPRAWRRLVAHSLRLGARWLARGARRRAWPQPRAGLYRLLVPLEPWRYFELARVADEPFAGDCLDVSSPKLLASTLNAAGEGRWVAVDLFADEIARWRVLDPDLDLRVEDARALPFDDDSFDAIACVSVIEHIAGDGDTRAMAEMWRVLRPGGVLHLTTNVAATHTDVWVDRPVWGEASEAVGGRIFFERRYSDGALAERLLALPWREECREYARERRPIHDRFFAARPWSFAAGPLLPLICPRNFAAIERAADLPPGAHAAVYLRLRKPA